MTNPLSLPSPSFQSESSQRGAGVVKQEHEGVTEGKRRRGREKQEGRAGRKCPQVHVAAAAAGAAAAVAAADA